MTTLVVIGVVIGLILVGLMLLFLAFFAFVPPLLYLISKVIRLAVDLVQRLVAFLHRVSSLGPTIWSGVLQEFRTSQSNAERIGALFVIGPVAIFCLPFFAAFVVTGIVLGTVRRIRSALMLLEDLARDFYDWWRGVIPKWIPSQEQIDRDRIRGIAQDLREINQRMKPKGPHGW